MIDLHAQRNVSLALFRQYCAECCRWSGARVQLSKAEDSLRDWAVLDPLPETLDSFPLKSNISLVFAMIARRDRTRLRSVRVGTITPDMKEGSDNTKALPDMGIIVSFENRAYFNGGKRSRPSYEFALSLDEARAILEADLPIKRAFQITDARTQSAMARATSFVNG